MTDSFGPPIMQSKTRNFGGQPPGGPLAIP
jgi:hypothetical protein